MNITYNGYSIGMIALFGLLAFVFSYIGAHMMARFSAALGLIDKPNTRSSHSRPTPRGGGVAVLLSFILSVLTYKLSGNSFAAPLPHQELVLIAILTISVCVGVMGLTDDIIGLSPQSRLLFQGLFSVLSVYVIYPMPTSGIPFFGELPLWAITLLGVVGLMWWLNLYNFMDGLDGLASSQTFYMAAAGGLGIALITLGEGTPATHLTRQMPWAEFFILAASCLGFLVINWHPAKIFLGDAGSLSLAYLLYMLAISSISASLLSYQFWLIIGASFVLDATYTLAQRIKNKASLSQAHREHTYQRLYDNTPLSQPQVVYTYLVWNCLVLLPCGLLSLAYQDFADHFLICTYAFTLCFMIYARHLSRPNKQKPTQI